MKFFLLFHDCVNLGVMEVSCLSYLARQIFSKGVLDATQPEYLLSLLSKFELALPVDNRNTLLYSLLPLTLECHFSGKDPEHGTSLIGVSLNFTTYYIPKLTLIPSFLLQLRVKDTVLSRGHMGLKKDHLYKKISESTSSKKNKIKRQ